MGKKKGSKGKGKADKAAAKAALKDEKRAKQERKAARKSKKQKGDEADDEDIDALLNEIVAEDAKRTAVTVSVVGAPTPRSNFSLVSLQNGSEVLLFGGELFDGRDCSECYNDVYRYQVEKNEWRKIESPNTPPPRCSHQAVAVRDHVYVFGGEFTTAYQFHHYKDLWRLDTKENAWERIEARDAPSPRSGHRMVLWKHYLLVFGGFYEASRGVKWFNDLYFFDLRAQRWHKASFASTAHQPSPRSGCSLVVHPGRSTAYLFGGYAKVSVSTNTQRGRAFEDVWALHLDPPPVEGKCPVARWEPIPRKGSGPGKRSGLGCCIHRNRMVVFGGVTDSETSNDVKGEFHRSLHAFDLDRHRWFELKLRKKGSENAAAASRERRKTKRQAQQQARREEESVAAGRNDDSGGDDDDDDDGMADVGLDDDAFYVIIDGKIVKVEMDEEEEEEEQEQEQQEQQDVAQGEAAAAQTSEDREGAKDPATEAERIAAEMLLSAAQPAVQPAAQPPPPAAASEAEDVAAATSEAEDAPHERMSAAITILGSRLLVLGGTCELGTDRLTFNDVWQLDMNKMESWNCVERGTWEEELKVIAQVQDAEAAAQAAAEAEEGGDDDEEDEDDDGGGGGDGNDAGAHPREARIRLIVVAAP